MRSPFFAEGDAGGSGFSLKYKTNELVCFGEKHNDEKETEHESF